MKLLSLFTMIALFLSFGQAQAQLEQVGPIRAKLMVRNGAILVDVREEAEVAALAYDAENVINVPLSQLATRMNEIPKDKKVVVACRSGNRSRRAAAQLMANGYTNIVNLDGGMNAWQAKGLDVVENGKAAAKGKSCCSKGAKGKSCCSKGAKGKSCSKGAKGKSCGSKGSN